MGTVGTPSTESLRQSCISNQQTHLISLILRSLISFVLKLHSQGPYSAEIYQATRSIVVACRHLVSSHLQSGKEHGKISRSSPSLVQDTTVSSRFKYRRVFRINRVKCTTSYWICPMEKALKAVPSA
jgi:hypothetical protein